MSEPTVIDIPKTPEGRSALARVTSTEGVFYDKTKVQAHAQALADFTLQAIRDDRARRAEAAQQAQAALVAKVGGLPVHEYAKSPGALAYSAGLDRAEVLALLAGSVTEPPRWPAPYPNRSHPCRDDSRCYAFAGHDGPHVYPEPPRATPPEGEPG